LLQYNGNYESIEFSEIFLKIIGLILPVD
jgi:hypothetical protein